MERTTVVTASAVLALAIAGCGTAAPKQLSAAQFRRTAASICTHRRAAYYSAEVRHHMDSLGEFRAALTAAKRSVRQLEAIRPPAALNAAYTQILAFERHQNDEIAAILHARRILPGVADRSAQRHQALRAELGMQDCD